MSKKKATKSTPKPKTAAAPRESLVVTSKVKQYVAKLGLRSEADFADAVSAKVGEMLRAAATRAKAHNVGTLRARDL